MTKSKGSALIYTILFMLLVLIMGLILLNLSYLGILSSTAVLKTEKYRNAAEAGIERGIQILKDSGGTVPKSPNNKLKYSTCNGEYNYTVEIYDTDPISHSRDNYYIASRVVSSDGSFRKGYVVRIDKNDSFKKNFFVESLCYSGLTVIGNETDSCFEIEDNASLCIMCPAYLQGENINLRLSHIPEYKVIQACCNTLHMDAAPMDCDLIYVDIPQEQYNSLNTQYNGAIKSCRMYKYNGIMVNDGINKDFVISDELVLFSRLDNKKVCMMDIYDTCDNLYKNITMDKDGLSEDILNKLSEQEGVYIQKYLYDSVVVKLVIVKGDIKITSGIYNNCLICCSGLIEFDGDIKMVNSSILCTGVYVRRNTKLQLYNPCKTKSDRIKDDLYKELKKHIINFTDGTMVKIVSWYDL